MLPMDNTGGVLTINDCTISFDGTPVLRIDALHIDDTPRAIAVLGVSGSGKSTLAALIGDYLSPAAAVTGTCTRNGTVSMVAQDAFGALNPLMPVIKQIALTAGSIDAAANLLESVGLKQELHNRFPLQLSGGQRQRAALAFALGPCPRLILADEVTSALDPVATADVVSTLRSVRDNNDATLLFITHDRGAAAALCDQAIIMIPNQDGSHRAHLCTDDEWAELRSLFGAGQRITDSSFAMTSFAMTATTETGAESMSEVSAL